jgi:hypothetical protein
VEADETTLDGATAELGSDLAVDVDVLDGEVGSGARRIPLVIAWRSALR